MRLGPPPVTPRARDTFERERRARDGRTHGARRARPLPRPFKNASAFLDDPFSILTDAVRDFAKTLRVSFAPNAERWYVDGFLRHFPFCNLQFAICIFQWRLCPPRHLTPLTPFTGNRPVDFARPLRTLPRQLSALPRQLSALPRQLSTLPRELSALPAS